MINDFLRFVYESKYDSFAEKIAADVMQLVSQGTDGTTKKRINKTMEFIDLANFSLVLSIVRSSVFEPAKRTNFKSLPWESINFKHNGFALDANSFIPKDGEDPEIVLNVVINPETEPECHDKLYYKLLDSIRHELEHVLQKGTNVQYTHSGREVDKNRKESEDSYKYFLLPDEMPAMVSGMRLASIKKGISIDQEFQEYLAPILSTGFITHEEFEKVMSAWVKFTIRHFPDTQISKKYRFR
jgi:hypothetical protein